MTSECQLLLGLAREGLLRSPVPSLAPSLVVEWRALCNLEEGGVTEGGSFNFRMITLERSVHPPSTSSWISPE